MNTDYVKFTEEMKRDYTILVPNMLPLHFKMLIRILKTHGYKMELLETTGRDIAELGLHYVHNDTCYPAILVVGQFMQAIKSGKYDTDKLALIMFQTGGGCRASNYISLIRKALANAGYGHIPVISMSLAGIEKHPGFKLTLPMLHSMLYAILYGDLLMTLTNQTKPYETVSGSADALAESWMERLSHELGMGGRVSYRKVRKNYKAILDDFAKIETNKTDKVRVGIVGEIFVKYSPLGNNNLQDFLLREGAECVVPGLLDFCLYSMYDNIMDRKLYGRKKIAYPIYRFIFHVLTGRQQDFINIIKKDGRFTPPNPFKKTLTLADGYISRGVKMGEGWLLTAEMLELSHSGVKNIVCTQPFGCLPNHICGKGMVKPIKEKNPDVNIVAIDYDAGATQVNQENRIKLMLANAENSIAG